MSRRLPNEEWLHLAKRVGVGSSRKVVHGREPTAAMTIGNTGDRWWAYCQRCKRGAVEKKEHALLVTKEVAKSRDLILPSDMRATAELESYERDTLAGFLASKGMDFMYLDYAYWSAERHRLMFNTKQGWLGRDTSGKSLQKWLSYTAAPYVEVALGATMDVAVLTEDLFSGLKVASATPNITVYCTLGTAIHDALMLKLIERKHRVVSSFYDGDSAGYKGVVRNMMRLLPFGMADRRAAETQCAPAGLDPKDMELRAIAQHVQTLRIEGD